MFTLVHIYTATQVAKKYTPLLVIGSVIPDFVWVSRENLPYENLHNDLDDFYNFVECSYEDVLDLALGMKLHSNKMGADLYSHFYKGGYAYTKGKALLPDIINLVGSKDEKKMADLTHTFIEASLDLHLYRDIPEVLELYKNSIKNVDFDKISEIFSNYAKIDKLFILQNIKALSNLVKPENLISEESFANNVLPTIIELGFQKKVEKNKVLEIFKKAMKLTRKDYKKFLEDTISMMKKDFP